MNAQDGIQNPFPGLRSFEPEEEHLFFGREQQIDELLMRLRKTRFLAVVGSSGSGKSSLVRCGLIPALYSGYMVQAGSFWRIAVFRPGDDPMGNLAGGLTSPEVFGEGELDDLYEPEEGAEVPDDSDEEVSENMDRALVETTLGRGSRGLVEAVKYASLEQGENLLVVVDQFEELFRFKRETKYTDSGDQAAAFMKLLLTATSQDALPIYVVLTMRSDFLENCTEFHGLTEAINEGQYLVPRLNREQRRAAITGPVAVSGTEITPRLVTRLLNDVGDNPDQLPIMQHVLMRTWSYWSRDHAPGEALDLRHYEAVGTMREALSLHAEEAYREQHSERNKLCARKVFETLTEKGTDGRGIRRPSKIKEICEITGVSVDSVMLVVETFRRVGRSFLVPPAAVPLTAETTLDISHESLMRVWVRLREWVDEEALSARLYMNLARAAERYQEGLTGLWRDPELQMALNWREESKPTAAWAERYDPSFERAMLFLEESRKQRDRAIAKRERLQKRRLWRSRWAASGFGLMAILLFVLSLLSYFTSQEAIQARKKAEKAKEEAVAAQGELREQKRRADENAERAVIEAKEAKKAKIEAERARGEAESNAAEARRQSEKARSAQEQAEQALSDTKKANQQTSLALSDARKEQKRAEREKKRAEKNFQEAQASKAKTKELLLLNFARDLAARAQRQQDPELAALAALQAFRFGASSNDFLETPEIHDALRYGLKGLDTDVDRSLLDRKDAIRALALGPNGRFLGIGDDSGSFYFLDITRPDYNPRLVQEVESGIRSVAISADIRFFAVGTVAGQIHTWDLDEKLNHGDYHQLEAHQGGVNSLAFRPNGALLASAGGDGKIRFHHYADAQAPPVTLSGFGNKVWSLAFRPDGAVLLVAGSAGVIALRDFSRSGKVSEPFLAQDDFRSVAFDDRGRFMAAGTYSGEILLWRTNAPDLALIFRGHHSSVNALDFSSDGRSLASASSDHRVLLWRVEEPNEAPIELRGHDSWVWDLSFNHEGTRIFSGGADRDIRIWTTHAEELAANMCKHLSRNLSRREWNELMFHEGAQDWRALLAEELEYRETCPGLPIPGPPTKMK